ncbi:MAG: PEP-CTERM sorting domain-containing protein [Phycisphaera sp.]|nr:PEP-CTERM sorting domain-containing protein [Phycisphaera sp.]
MIGTKTATLVVALAVTVAVNSAGAAIISFAGSQLNVDPKITTSGTTDSVGWRNTAPVKTYDLDGDNIIGTDGYDTRSGTSIPSYITGYSHIGSGNPFGYMDDPANPGNNDYRAGFWGANSSSATMFTFSITGTSLNGKKLGVAIQYDAYNTGSQIYTLSQIAGSGSGSVSQTVTALNNGYDWAYFYIEGATAGDTFQMTSAKPATGSINYLSMSALAFDSAPIPEPASLALLGLGGLLMIKPRRA